MSAGTWCCWIIERGRIAGAGTGGVGDWSNCPGLTATSVVGRAGADATVLPIANNGSGTVTLFDPGTGSCRDTGTIGDQNSEYGTAVETGGDVFIPDLATRRVLIVRADTGALVATTDPLDTPGPFELQTAGGLVFYNDPDSPAAGRVEIQGVISQPKYTDGTTGIAVQGTQTTPDPPDEPPDEIDQPLDEWSCSTQQTQAVAGTPVTFEVLGPTAVQTVAWEFSNGTTGQGNPIETTFTTTGTITGTATITTDTGTQTTSCNTITVVNNETELELVARFTISNAKPVAGNPVTFTNKSEGNPTTWAWTFQDGTPATSNQQNPTVVFNTEGQHTVTLTITNGTSRDTDTRTITVKPDTGEPPKVTIGAAKEVAAGNSVLIRAQVTQGAPTTYTWTLDPDTPNEQTRTGETITYTWQTPGTHRINLTAADKNNQTTTATTTINVLAEPNPTIDSPTTITLNNQPIDIRITGNVDIPLTDIKTWTWTSNIHGTLTGRTQNLTITPTQATTANNKLTLTLQITTTNGQTRTTPTKTTTITTTPTTTGTATIVLNAPSSIRRYWESSPLTTTGFSIQGEKAGVCEVASVNWTITDLSTNKVHQQGTLGNRDFDIGIRWGSTDYTTYRIAVTGTPVQKTNCTVAPASADVSVVLTTNVPTGLVGLTADEARSVVNSAGLEWDQDNSAPGYGSCTATVTGTRPAGGSEIELHGSVTPSLGWYCEAVVPNIIGARIDSGVGSLFDAGFDNYTVSETNCDASGLGPPVVTAVSPSPGSRVDVNTTITVTAAYVDGVAC